MSVIYNLRGQYQFSENDKKVIEKLRSGKIYNNLGKYIGHQICIGEKSIEIYYIFESDERIRRYTAIKIINALGI